jgi:hypothetical protein
MSKRIIYPCSAGLAVFAVVAAVALTALAPAAVADGATWSRAALRESREPNFLSCDQAEPALALVANLRHVRMGTACRLTIAIQKHEPPSKPVTPEHPCRNPFVHMHRFRGWRLRVLNRGYGIMRRGRSSFAFEYQDGPLECL